VRRVASRRPQTARQPAPTNPRRRDPNGSDLDGIGGRSASGAWQALDCVRAFRSIGVPGNRVQYDRSRWLMLAPSALAPLSFSLLRPLPPLPVLYEAPYEVTETGWGEFIINIQIDFHAISGLEPIVLSHTLKLFPLPNVQPSTKKPVRQPIQPTARYGTVPPSLPVGFIPVPLLISRLCVYVCVCRYLSRLRCAVSCRAVSISSCVLPPR